MLHLVSSENKKFQVSEIKSGTILKAGTVFYLFLLFQALSQHLAYSRPTVSILTTLSTCVSWLRFFSLEAKDFKTLTEIFLRYMSSRFPEQRMNII